MSETRADRVDARTMARLNITSREVDLASCDRMIEETVGQLEHKRREIALKNREVADLATTESYLMLELGLLQRLRAAALTLEQD